MPNESLDASTAYQLVHDHLATDWKAYTNMATFVTSYMDPEAEKLMMENLSKNLADRDIYGQVAQLESRCLSMLHKLWNAPKGSAVVGTSTIGSSEAIHLGGLGKEFPSLFHLILLSRLATWFD